MLFDSTKAFGADPRPQSLEIVESANAKVRIYDLVFSDGDTFTGKLSLNLPQNDLADIAVSGTYATEGDTLTATVPTVSLKVAGATLTLNQLTIGRKSVTAESGEFQLPAKLGGISAPIGALSINEDGLRIGEGTAAFSLPNLRLGTAAVGFSVTGVQANILVAADRTYKLNMAGAVAVAIPGFSTNVNGQISLDGNGALSGVLENFSLGVAGMGVEISGMELRDDGTFAVAAASLSMPAAFAGGPSASINNLVISPTDGLSIGGGKFSLPGIKAGGFRLGGASGELQKDGNRYRFTGEATIGVPGLGAAGCEGLTVRLGIYVDAATQAMHVDFTPAREANLVAYGMGQAPNAVTGFGLRELALSFRCPIPLGQSGLAITEISGGITLADGTVKISAAMEVSTVFRVPAVGPVISVRGSLELQANPFEITVGGQLKLLGFKMVDASARIGEKGFSGTVRVEMIVARGQVSLNVFGYKGGVAFTASGRIEIGIPKGAILSTRLPLILRCPNGVTYIPIIGPCWFWQSKWVVGGTLDIPNADFILGSVQADGGLFEGNVWGFKGSATILGTTAAFFVDGNGKLSLGGNASRLKLVTPPSVALARTMLSNQIARGSNSRAIVLDGERYAFPSATTVERPVNVPTTRDAVFMLTRAGSKPTMSLRRPDGSLVTPNDSVPGIDYEEETTYTSREYPGAEVAAVGGQLPVGGLSRVRFVNTSTVATQVNQTDGGNVTSTASDNIAAGAASQYLEVAPGTYTYSAVRESDASLIASVSITLENQRDYTVVVGETALNGFTDQVFPLPQTDARVRLVNASGAGALDMSVQGGANLTSGVAANGASTYSSVSAGATTIEVRQAGAATALASLPISVQNGAVYTIVAFGNAGGTPAFQLFALTDATSATAHVRFVNSVSGLSNATLKLNDGNAETSEGGAINTGVVTPYGVRPADSYTAQIFGGGSPVLTLPALAIAADGDYSVVAYGTAASPLGLLLADDNTLPAVGKARVRVVHTDVNSTPTVNVTLSGAASATFSGVGYGTASSYQQVDAGISTVTAPSGTAPAELEPGAVYSVFITPAGVVVQVDVTALENVDVSYYIDQAVAGTWTVKLDGVEENLQSFSIDALLFQPAPSISPSFTAVMVPGTSQVRISYSANSPDSGAKLRLVANPGEKTRMLDDDPGTVGDPDTAVEVFEGQQVADLTFGDNRVETVDLVALESGTYNLFLEADDGENELTQVYALAPVTVDNAVNWPTTWTTPINITQSESGLDLAWQELNHADVDGYTVVWGTSPAALDNTIDFGDTLYGSIDDVDYGQTIVLAIVAQNDETGKQVRSQTTTVTRDAIPFVLSGTTQAALISGQTTQLALSVTTSVAAFPAEGVYLETGDSLPEGLDLVFADDVVAPTSTGQAVAVTLLASPELASGTYIVPIIASGAGTQQKLSVEVQVSAPSFELKVASTFVRVEPGATVTIDIEAVGRNGANDPIFLDLVTLPAQFTATFSSQVVRPGQKIALTITNNTNRNFGFPLQIVGESGGEARQLNLIVGNRYPVFLSLINK